MIAQRFRPLGWAAGVATAATALYLVSLQVAAERGKLEAVERQISEARRELRALQTELGTRASLRQLEAWNGEVLSLSAPKAGQFAADAAELTALDLAPDDDAAPATPRALLAAATTAAPVEPAVVAPVAAPAVAPKPKPVEAKPAAPKVDVRTAEVRTKAGKTTKPAKPQRVAMLDARTMGEVVRVAAREGRTRP